MEMKPHRFLIRGPWKGRLAIVSRPRGGEWLKDDVEAWKRAGWDVVVSLLTPQETNEMDLGNEGTAVQASGLEFISFPIDDRSVPTSRKATLDLLTNILDSLEAGKNVAVHCRQGIGRSSIVVTGLLILSGAGVERALREVSAARGLPVPETADQRRWITDFGREIKVRLLTSKREVA
jgi:protein-tyrosine phosphatase